MKHQKGPDDKHSYAHVASLLGMKSISPRAIAYTAVQVSDHFPNCFGDGTDLMLSCGLLCRAVPPGTLLMMILTIKHSIITSLCSLRIVTLNGRRNLLTNFSYGGISECFPESISKIFNATPGSSVFGRKNASTYRPQAVEKKLVALTLRKHRDRTAGSGSSHV